MATEFKQVIMIEGCDEQFDTKAEAMDYLRRPKILAALLKLTDNNVELSDWLVENRDVVTNAFDTGTIRRITKSEQKKIDKAFERMTELLASGDKAFDFLVDNIDNITIKYKPQPRMSDAEKKLAAKNTLMLASDGNEDLSDWTIANEEAILEAFNAGKEKRVVSPKAAAGLEAYRAGKTEEKRLVEEGMAPEEAEAKGKELYEKLKAAAAA